MSFVGDALMGLHIWKEAHCGSRNLLEAVVARGHYSEGTLQAREKVRKVALVSGEVLRSMTWPGV